MIIVEATVEDIPQIATHHRKMSEEMWEINGQNLESGHASEIERNYTSKLHKELPAGNCRAWA